MEGEYTYYVVTRDSVTKQTLLYTDAKKEIEFTDNSDDAVTDADNVINFFHDDLAVPNEASSGAVALLNIYNYVLDSNAIKQNFNALNQQVFSTGPEFGKESMLSVYPNPAKEMLTVAVDPSALEGTAILELVSPSGRTLWSHEIRQGGTFRIGLEPSVFPEGLYLVRMQSGTKLISRKVMVCR